jgi:hypothetical protein
VRHDLSTNPRSRQPDARGRLGWVTATSASGRDGEGAPTCNSVHLAIGADPGLGAPGSPVAQACVLRMLNHDSGTDLAAARGRNSAGRVRPRATSQSVILAGVDQMKCSVNCEGGRGHDHINHLATDALVCSSAA